MLNKHQLLVEFVLDQAAHQPVPKRIAIYRALADFCGHEAQAMQLNRMASDLESAERRCAEFHFHFAQKKT